MIETLNLLPRVSGPGVDPALYGVADGLARLFPREDIAIRPAPEPTTPDAIAAERIADLRAAWRPGLERRPRSATFVETVAHPSAE